MNQISGFLIRKLRITGVGKLAVGIDLQQGLNVISGPSNKGKSYIFSCINYALGGTEMPEEIEEAKGYENVVLEIEDRDGYRHTILRSMIEDTKKAYISSVAYDDFVLANSRKVYASHTANRESISSFMLAICQVPDVRLKKNSYNETISLTFRQLYKITAIDEVRIISKKSPAYFSGQKLSETSDRSLFKYLLTNVDDSDVKEIERNVIYKGKIQAKIDFIDSLIAQTQEQIEDMMKNVDNVSIDVNDALIADYTKGIGDSNKLLEEYRGRKQYLIEENVKLESKALLQEELRLRFDLLKDHYYSDLKRLEFLKDGSFLLAQLSSVVCPSCGTKLDEEHSQCLQDNYDINMVLAVKAEYDKISLKLKDLDSTIIEVVEDRDKTLFEIKTNLREVSFIEDQVRTKIEPARTYNIQEIEAALQERSKRAQIASLTELVSSYANQRHEQNILLNSGNTKALEAEVEHESYSIYRGFCDEVKSLLDEWRFPNISTVEFNTSHEKYDLQISGKERSKDGKGFRAITYSAFVIGLMNYCQRIGTPHPSVVILDSPVTNYQDSAKASKTKTQDISDDMADAFFTSLVKTPASSQIIIIENKQPSEEVKQMINYIDFYKDGPLFPAI